MSEFATHQSDSDADRTPLPAGKLSANGQWIFGSVYAGLALIGFSFGVWAGASKPKPAEVAEIKKDNTEKPPVTPPVVKPPVTPPVEPKPKDNTPPVVTPPVEPKPKDNTPPVVEPKKEPEPEPKPKVEIQQVAFKDVSALFVRYCNNCHGAVGKPKGGADLRTLVAIMKGGENGVMVKPGEPDKSSLYLSIKMGTMPPDGKPGPNEKELKMIHDWIAGGAKPRRTVRGRREVKPARHTGYSPMT